MDMLGERKMRGIIYKYYEESGEDELVRKAVESARSKEIHTYNKEIESSHGYIARIQQLRFTHTYTFTHSVGHYV